MPVIALFAKSALGWLKGASFWQIVALALAGYAVVQHFQLADARHDRDAYQKQRDGYRATLDTLAKQSRETQQQTRDIITRYQTVTVPRVEREVRIVETAPLPGECKTPEAIMGADL